MSEPATVEACLVVDDFPMNASFVRRAQAVAMGFPQPEVCAWSMRWPAQASAVFMTLPNVHRFADLIESYGLRGKFTLLPCPGGLGRIDRSVRGLSDADLATILETVRRRIAPSFDVGLEVLTHSMALDPATEALLPHTESAWVAYLCAPGAGRFEKLCAYLRHGWTILRNVGIEPRSLTIGGMPDVSGIDPENVLRTGRHNDRLADAMAQVRNEIGPRSPRLVMRAALLEPKEFGVRPRLVKRYADGLEVFDLLCGMEDIVLPALNADADVNALADGLISPGLEKGTLIDVVNAGRILYLVVHTQTLNSLNTGQGLSVLAIVLERLRQRFGKKLVWRSSSELAGGRV